MAVFGAYLYDQANPPSEERLSGEYELLYHIFESLIIKNVQKCGRLTGMILEPPQYMLEELKEKLR
jgi:hypothetical protein